MSSCEKCWADSTAQGIPYHRLLLMRKDQPCSPEEQAGHDAKVCPRCQRRTIHQYTDEPMCGCKPIGPHDRVADQSREVQS